MGLFKGGFMRLTSTFLYFLAFLASAVILGIYAYFLSVLADRNVSILSRWKAVTGMAGGGALFALIAVLLTCCLGGITFFGFIAILLDIALVGAFIAIAILTRSATRSCGNDLNTYLNTPLGLTASSSFDGEATYAVSGRTACRLNKAAFACSIIGAFLFLIAAIFQVLLIRSGKKEKRYGPSPANNYTSGSGKRNYAFWNKKSKNSQVVSRDAEMGTAVGAPVGGGLAAPAQDIRPSYETGTTVGNNANVYDSSKVDGAHSGYYTQPQGTGVNPYGQTGTATNY